MCVVWLCYACKIYHQSVHHVILNKLQLIVVMFLPEYDIYKYVYVYSHMLCLCPQCLFALPASFGKVLASPRARLRFPSNSLSLLCRRFGCPYQIVQQFRAVTQRDGHLERAGFEREPVDVVQAGRSFGRKIALMHQQGGEEEELYSGQLLADAPALPHREYQHVGGQVFVESPVPVQEALRIEHLWLVPFVRIVVQRPLVDKNDSILGDGITVDGRVRSGAVGNGHGHERSESHDFVDEGQDVRKLMLVFDGGEASAVRHFVHVLLKTFLNFRIPER